MNTDCFCIMLTGKRRANVFRNVYFASVIITEGRSYTSFVCVLLSLIYSFSYTATVSSNRNTRDFMKMVNFTKYKHHGLEMLCPLMVIRAALLALVYV